MKLDVYSPLLLDVYKPNECNPVYKNLSTSCNVFSKFTEEITVNINGEEIEIRIPNYLPFYQYPILYKKSEVVKVRWSGNIYYVVPIGLLVRNSNGNAYNIRTFVKVPQFIPETDIPIGQLSMFD
jgi:hypothetical protein